MSSHREAPESSKDPVADNTDVYAFVSPDAPDTVTLIANFIPFQIPQGGPNFAEFGDDVLYEIHVSNGGTAESDLSYQFRFTTKVGTPGSFLYNTGPINTLTDTTWSRKQFYTVTKVSGRKRTVIAKNLACPPVNVGVRTFAKTPYHKVAEQAVHKIGDRTFFAGQRAEGFFVDLGSIFDLGALRPFNADHLIKEHGVLGINGTQDLNVHSIAIQVPIKELSRSGRKPAAGDADATIGVWATAGRQRARVFNSKLGKYVGSGPFVQVSRLGNPLINEVINPVSQKDPWNAAAPKNDSAYVANYKRPQLSGLLNVLYPGAFPNLAEYGKDRSDIVAILLVGLPPKVVPSFPEGNNTGPVLADMLRLNLGVPPAKKPNAIGVLAGDNAGFPNGRRVFDNVTAVELRALAGATLPLVDPSFKPDAAAALLTDGTKNTNSPYLTKFPYLGVPAGGYESLPGTPKTA